MLWGSKIAALGGLDVASWPYWKVPANAKMLQEGIFADVTSVMDFGIILGALLAAGLAGKFSPSWRVAPLSLLAAVIGGLLLGYGARLAYGCNIGAYFSGIASSSLHGWVWLAAAFAGSWLGICCGRISVSASSGSPDGRNSRPPEDRTVLRQRAPACAVSDARAAASPIEPARSLATQA